MDLETAAFLFVVSAKCILTLAVIGFMVLTIISTD